MKKPGYFVYHAKEKNQKKVSLRSTFQNELMFLEIIFNIQFQVIDDTLQSYQSFVFG